MKKILLKIFLGMIAIFAVLYVGFLIIFPYNRCHDYQNEYIIEEDSVSFCFCMHMDCDEKIVESADIKTFEIIQHGHGHRDWYAKDKNYVYEWHTIFPNEKMPADPETFEVLSGGYTKDKNYIYIMGGIFVKDDGGHLIKVLENED